MVPNQGDPSRKKTRSGRRGSGNSNDVRRVCARNREWGAYCYVRAEGILRLRSIHQGKKSVPMLRDGAKSRASSARTDCASAKKVTVLFRIDVNSKIRVLLSHPTHWPVRAEEGVTPSRSMHQDKKSVPMLRDGVKRRASSARTDCASAKKVTVLFRTDVNSKIRVLLAHPTHRPVRAEEGW